MRLALDAGPAAAVAHDDVPIGAVVRPRRRGDRRPAQRARADRRPDRARRGAGDPRRRRRRRPLAAARLHAVRHARAVRDVRRGDGQRAASAAWSTAPPTQRPAPWPACTRCAAIRALNHRPPVVAGVPRRGGRPAAARLLRQPTQLVAGQAARAGGCYGRSPCRRMPLDCLGHFVGDR